MPFYTQLSQSERQTIAQLHSQNVKVAAIANTLGRNRSTIKREIERNGTIDKEGHFIYDAEQAILNSQQRKIEASKTHKYAHGFTGSMKVSFIRRLSDPLASGQDIKTGHSDFACNLDILQKKPGRSRSDKSFFQVTLPLEKFSNRKNTKTIGTDSRQTLRTEYGSDTFSTKKYAKENIKKNTIEWIGKAKLGLKLQRISIRSSFLIRLPLGKLTVGKASGNFLSSQGLLSEFIDLKSVIAAKPKPSKNHRSLFFSKFTSNKSQLSAAAYTADNIDRVKVNETSNRNLRPLLRENNSSNTLENTSIPEHKSILSPGKLPATAIKAFSKRIASSGSNLSTEPPEPEPS